MSTIGTRRVWPEAWRRNASIDFGLSPLETSSSSQQKIWRGVRFSSVYEEFYYEPDNFDFDRPYGEKSNVCLETGEDLSQFPGVGWYRKHGPTQALWSNLITTFRLGVVMLAPGVADALPYIEMGLSNPVPVDGLTVSAFRAPGPDESEDCGVEDFDWLSCINIAVSYTHDTGGTPGGSPILKASREQLAQLEDILLSLREHTPYGVKFVRLWTDQILSEKLKQAKDHNGGSGKDGILPTNKISWVVYGLIPYVIYTVACLQSNRSTDSVSMWSACEQILGDAGAGILISTKALFEIGFPAVCKDRMTCHDNSRTSEAKSFLIVGDRLSVPRSFQRLAFAIHAGLLDDMVTFHIADAQALIRFSYYITRTTEVHLFHGLNCETCLTRTGREAFGFHFAVHNVGDWFDQETSADLRLRLNRCRASYPFPKARARRGFVSWHGYREFAPGAGRVARFAEEPMSSNFRKHSYAIRVQDKNENGDSGQWCVALAAVPFVKETWITNYIVLLVHGRDLYNRCQNLVEWSVRLNFNDIEKFHSMFQKSREELFNSRLSDWFHHPEFDEILKGLEVCKEESLRLLSELGWGYSSAEGGDCKQENGDSSCLSAFLHVG